MILHEGIQHAIGRHNETGNLRNQAETPCPFAALQREDAACLLALHPAGGPLHRTVGQLGHNSVVPRMPVVQALPVIDRQGQGGLHGEHHLGRLRFIRQPLHRLLRSPEGGNHDLLDLFSEIHILCVQRKDFASGQLAQRLPGALQRSVHSRISAPVGELAAAHAVGNGGKEYAFVLHPVHGMIILTGHWRRASLVRRPLKRDSEGRDGGILEGFPCFISRTFLR